MDKNKTSYRVLTLTVGCLLLLSIIAERAAAWPCPPPRPHCETCTPTGWECLAECGCGGRTCSGCCECDDSDPRDCSCEPNDIKCGDPACWDCVKCGCVCDITINSVSSNKDAACVGCNITFTASVTGSCSCVDWSSGGGDPATASDTCTFTTHWDSPGTKTVTATPDCGSSKSKQVAIIGGPIESLDNCGEPYGKYLLLVNPANLSPYEYYRAKPGQPSGTTYKWEISSGASKAHIVGSDTSSTVTLKADAEGNLTLKLTYTKAGSSCVSYLGTAVQKPNQANSSLTCNGWQWFCGAPGNQYMEATRLVYCYVCDGSNRPVPHALWDETWAGGCSLMEGDAYTLCDGSVLDTIWCFRYWYCDASGVICSDTQRIKVEGWPTSGYFWTNNMTFSDGVPPNSCPNIDLAGRGCPHCQVP